MCERASDSFIISVCSRIFDLAAERIARADRVPQNVSNMPKIAIYGDIFSEAEAESMRHGYRAFALSGYEVVFVDPQVFIAGHWRMGAYAGESNQGDIEIAVTRRDFADLAHGWMTTYPHRYSPRRVEKVRQWLERFRGRLVHEIRHAFDSTSSEDRYVDNKRAAQATRLWFGAQGRPAHDPLTQAAHRSYMRSPHEISARFSAAVAEMQNRTSTPWQQWREEFKKKFQGFDLLSPNDKRRLVVRMYQVWREQQMDDAERSG